MEKMPRNLSRKGGKSYDQGGSIYLLTGKNGFISMNRVLANRSVEVLGYASAVSLY